MALSGFANRDLSKGPYSFNIGGLYRSQGTTGGFGFGAGGGFGSGGASLGGGRGGMMETLERYRQEQQSALDRANAKNEARYGDILNQYQSRYQRGIDAVNSLGGSLRDDVARRGRERLSDADQRVVNSGLAGSTIGTSVRNAVNRETDAEQRRVEDMLLERRASADAQLSKDKLDFMERRRDVAPDQSSFISLAQHLGASAGGAIGNGIGFIGSTDLNGSTSALAKLLNPAMQMGANVQWQNNPGSYNPGGTPAWATGSFSSMGPAGTPGYGYAGTGTTSPTVAAMQRSAALKDVSGNQPYWDSVRNLARKAWNHLPGPPVSVSP